MSFRKVTRYSQFITKKDLVVISGRAGERVIPLKEILDVFKLSELKLYLETSNVKIEISLSIELGNVWIEIREVNSE